MSFTPPSFTQIEPLEDAQYINAPAKPEPALLTRAILFGIGGALAGAIVYALFIGITHINIGYLAIGVAWLVAKAMTTGSRGQGGRSYQILAVVLTYLSVAAANVAVLVWTLSQDGEHIVFSPRAILGLAKIGLEYPFLRFESDGFSAVIGLVILVIGLRAAWRMTSGVPGAVKHPFAR